MNIVIGWKLENFILILGFLCMLWIGCRKILIKNLICIPSKKCHTWKLSKILSRACYCSHCQIMLPASIGLFCCCCGVCSHTHCTRLLDLEIKCKDKFIRNQKFIYHHWVKGNLPLNLVCNFCKKDIDFDTSSGLYGYRCCWCQRVLHNQCFKRFPVDICDFGEFKTFIIPPTSVVATRTRKLIKAYVKEIIPPPIKNWKPLIVIANKKSGSCSTSEVLALFRGFLHPLQIIEMGKQGPVEVLQWLKKVSPHQCRILVAGGDGTIGWVLNTIFEANIEPIPELAILPIGTGNDLSRVLGWGANLPVNFDAVEVLRHVKSANVTNLDRWTLKIELSRVLLPFKSSLKPKVSFIYNYFSIGVDALVTLNFHKTRESPFYFWSSRLLNKMIYFGFGTQQIVQRDCEGLEENLQIFLDGKEIVLPELQSVVFLNIDSWGAGVKLCELSRNDKNDIQHSISDGIIEVFGIVSSFHIAQLQLGLGRPIFLGQAKEVQIKIKQPLPVQSDGEPWIQNPCEIKIFNDKKAKMLYNQL